MKTSETIGKVVSALHEAEREIGDVTKGGRNTFQKYSYARLEDLLDATKATLLKHGVVVVGSAESVTQLESSEKMFRVSVALVVRFCHTSGEWIEVTCVGEGADQQDKATYKAITGARKYAIAGALNLATTDDPDSDGPGKYDPGKSQDTAAKANDRLGIAPRAEQMTADQCRTIVKDLCKSSRVPLKDVSRWLANNGAETLDQASPELRQTLIEQLKGGSL